MGSTSTPSSLAVPVNRLGHLHRQLPGRDQDEGRRHLAAGLDELKQRQGEGRRLPRPGGGQPHQVPPLQQVGDGRGLNGRGLFIAQLGEGLEQIGPEAELGEGLVSRG